MQIYLGNSAPEVDESSSYELVSNLAPSSSVRMPKHKTTRTHQGYGFAQFADRKDAEYVSQLSTEQPIKSFGRQIRAKSAAKSKDGGMKSLSAGSTDAAPSRPNTPPAESYVPRIFVGNLDASAAADAANSSIPFGKFGDVARVEYVKVDGSDTIHAFVQMKTQAGTKAAIAASNNEHIMNRRVRVESER